MKIKVCGLKFPLNISEVAALKPDYVGFICYERSPRYICGLEDVDLNGVEDDIVRVGVFVNTSTKEMNELAAQYNFGAVQLHGSESPECCGEFKGRLTVIKAFGVDEDFDFETLVPYYDVVDYFLFDTKTEAQGGSGETFDWSVLDKYKGKVPFFLSGGLGPDNIEEVAKIKHPLFYGVDLNSRFETQPAVKDIEKLKEAFKKIKELSSDEVRS